ncbi:MAG: diacylglycerol kinase family protein [Actinomycetota bacterium]|nr:diacylglycerol kinase family protein [Actinomycetota bacterium]
MRRALFVISPAGIRHLHVLERHCREASEAYGWAAELLVTEEGERSAELHHDLSSYAGEEGERLVFAVGGDGTVRACAHDLARSGVPLSIVPRGTANLFSRSLDLPVDLEQALRIGFTGDERLVDVAFACGQPFVAMAGIGIDAAVVESTPRFFKQHLGWLGYGTTGLAHLAGPGHEVTLRLDGGEPLTRWAHAVVVGNVGILPGGFTILPGAALDDGLLDVGVLEPKGLSGWLRIARLAVTGIETRDHFEHFRAAKVEVEVGEELPRQLDGDLLPPARSLSVEVQERALLVKVRRRGGGIAGGPGTFNHACLL